MLLFLLPCLAYPWVWGRLRPYWPEARSESALPEGHVYDYLRLLDQLRRDQGSIDEASFRRAGLQSMALRQAAVAVALDCLDPEKPDWADFDQEFLRYCAQQRPQTPVILQMVDYGRRPSTSGRVRVCILKLFEWEEGMQPAWVPAESAHALRRLAAEVGVDLGGGSPNGWSRGDWFYPSWSEHSQAVLLSLLLDRQDPPLPVPGSRVWGALFFLLVQNDSLTPGQSRWLARQLDGDLRPLAGVGLSGWTLERAAHLFPDSRFARGCREYAALRGGGYFVAYREDTSDRAWCATARLRAPGWRGWLQRYPDHPGADDALYWEGRCLEWSGHRLQALELLADQMAAPRGDGDLTDLIQDRLVLLLDVGTTRAELEQFCRRHPNHPLAPLARYAWSVRLAREHRYSEALEASRGLDLAQATNRYLGNRLYALDEAVEEQRQLWTRLAGERSRWALARAWAAEDGWKIGYLQLHRGNRVGRLSWWYARWLDTPELGSEVRVDRPVLARQFQLANHNAVALELVEKVIGDPHASAAVVEKACFLRVSLLDFQYQRYPFEETCFMHPLPGLDTRETRALRAGRIDLAGGLESWESKPTYRTEVARWYRDQTEWAVRDLLRRFPNSRYGDDALLVLYDLTGDRKYADEASARFPQGDLVRSLAP